MVQIHCYTLLLGCLGLENSPKKISKYLPWSTMIYPSHPIAWQSKGGHAVKNSLIIPYASLHIKHIQRHIFSLQQGSCNQNVLKVSQSSRESGILVCYMTLTLTIPGCVKWFQIQSTLLLKNIHVHWKERGSSPTNYTLLHTWSINVEQSMDNTTYMCVWHLSLHTTLTYDTNRLCGLYIYM